MKNIRKALKSIKKSEERGLSDIVNALILMPLMIILIFTVFNVGNYLYTLSLVTNEVALGARMTGLYGGEDSTLAKNRVKVLTGSSGNVSTYVRDRIYDSGAGACRIGLVSGRCEPPTVTCTKSTIDIRPGSIVSCTVEYGYISFLDGLDFGISSVLERPRIITQSAVAEVSNN